MGERDTYRGRKVAMPGRTLACSSTRMACEPKGAPLSFGRVARVRVPSEPRRAAPSRAARAASRRAPFDAPARLGRCSSLISMADTPLGLFDSCCFYSWRWITTTSACPWSWRARLCAVATVCTRRRTRSSVRQWRTSTCCSPTLFAIRLMDCSSCLTGTVGERPQSGLQSGSRRYVRNQALSSPSPVHRLHLLAKAVNRTLGKSFHARHTQAKPAGRGRRPRAGHAVAFAPGVFLVLALCCPTALALALAVSRS